MICDSHGFILCGYAWSDAGPGLSGVYKETQVSTDAAVEAPCLLLFLMPGLYERMCNVSAKEK